MKTKVVIFMVLFIIFPSIVSATSYTGSLSRESGALVNFKSSMLSEHITVNEKKENDKLVCEFSRKNQILVDLSQAKLANENNSKILDALKSKIGKVRSQNDLIEVNVTLKYNSKLSKQEFIQKHYTELKNSIIDPKGYGGNSFFLQN